VNEVPEFFNGTRVFAEVDVATEDDAGRARFVAPAV
jgi:hypothetical protein